MVKKINAASFSEARESAVAVVDFSAVWCGPCKMLAPVLEQVSEELTEVNFYNVDVDECMELAQEFGITNIPALAVMKEGKLVDMAVGFRPYDELVDFIQAKL